MGSGSSVLLSATIVYKYWNDIPASVSFLSNHFIPFRQSPHDRENASNFSSALSFFTSTSKDPWNNSSITISVSSAKPTDKYVRYLFFSTVSFMRIVDSSILAADGNDYCRPRPEPNQVGYLWNREE